MTSKLIEALNKCETRKSYENVRYTLIDDELRAYIEESLERLEHYDLIKSDMDIFERYRYDLNYICNLLNTYCKDREDWNSIVFKFQSIIGAINCCQFQQGAYDRLEELKKNNKEIEELYLNENKHWCETIDNLKKHNGRLTRKIQNLYKEHATLIYELSLLRNNNNALLKLIGEIEVLNND